MNSSLEDRLITYYDQLTTGLPDEGPGIDAAGSARLPETMGAASRPRTARSILLVGAVSAVLVLGVGAIALRPSGDRVGPVSPPTPARSVTPGGSTASPTTATGPSTTVVEVVGATDIAKGAPAARPCTGSDLQAVADPIADGAMGNVKHVIHLTNISDTACDIPTGPLSLSAIDASNNIVPLATGPETYFGDPAPLTGPLAPQGTAVVWLGGGQPTLCKASAITWPGFYLELPDHTRVRFASNIDTGCSIGISIIGSPSK